MTPLFGNGQRFVHSPLHDRICKYLTGKRDGVGRRYRMRKAFVRVSVVTEERIASSSAEAAGY